MPRQRRCVCSVCEIVSEYVCLIVCQSLCLVRVRIVLCSVLHTETDLQAQNWASRCSNQRRSCRALSHTSFNHLSLSENKRSSRRRSSRCLFSLRRWHAETSYDSIYRRMTNNRSIRKHGQFLLNELSVNSLLTPAAACAAAAQPLRGRIPEDVTKKTSSSPPISLEAAAEARLQSSLLEEEASIMKDSERNDRKELVVDLCHLCREKMGLTRVKVMQKGHTNANEEEEGPLPKFTTTFSPTSLAYTSELNLLLPPSALPITATFTMQRLSRNPSNTLAPVDKERGREAEEERQQQ